MKVTYITLLFIFSFLKLFSIDDISKIENQIKLSKDSVKINLYNNLFWEYLKIDNSKANETAKSLLDYSHSINNLKGEADANKQLGISFKKIGIYDSSINYFNHAINLYNKFSDNSNLARCYDHLGEIECDRSNYYSALKYVLNAYDYFEKVTNPEGKIYCYSLLSSIYLETKNYHESKVFALKALEYAKKTKIEEELVIAQIINGQYFFEVKDYKTAFFYFREAISISTQSNNSFLKSKAYFMSANSLQNTKDYIFVAYRYALSGLDISLKSNDHMAQYEAYTILASISSKQNKIEKSKEYYKKALKLSKEKNLKKEAFIFYELSKIEPDILESIKLGEKSFLLSKNDNSRENIYKSALLLAHKYQNNENYKASAYYYKLSENYQDSLNKNISFYLSIKELNFNHKMNKKDEETNILKSENTSHLQNIQEKIKKEFWLIGIILAMIILVVWVFYLQNKERKAKEILSSQNLIIQKQTLDISEKSEELESQVEKLKNLNEDVKTLMYVVSHDIKSPLNKILSIYELMSLDSSNFTADQLQLFGLIKKISTDARNFVVNLLDISAIENQFEDYIAETLYFNALVKEVVDSFKLQAQNKNITIVEEYRNINQNIKGNKEMIILIIDNILSNALKYSFKNSEINILIEETDDNLLLSIKDFGPGMTEEDKSMMFQKFKKLSARPTAGEASNGLGLYIAKLLTEKNGGKLWCVSERKQGCTFFIELLKA